MHQQAICQNVTGRMATSVDPDQTAPQEQDLHCLLMQVYPNILCQYRDFSLKT